MTRSSQLLFENSGWITSIPACLRGTITLSKIQLCFLFSILLTQTGHAQTVQQQDNTSQNRVNLNGLNPALFQSPQNSGLDNLSNQTQVGPSSTTPDGIAQPTQLQTLDQQSLQDSTIAITPGLPNQTLAPGASQVRVPANPPAAGLDQTPVASIPQLQGGGVVPVQPAPFDPLGIRRGRFILRPALDVTGGYTSNSTNDVTGAGSAFGTVGGEITIDSDFSRHSVGLQAQGDFSRFTSGSDASDIAFDISANAQYEFDDDTSLTGTIQAIFAEDDITGVADDPFETNIIGSLQFDHALNQIDTETELSIARTINDSFTDAAGIEVSQDDLNSFVLAGRLRGTLRRSASIEPFIEAEVEREIFDEDVDDFGNERNVLGLRGQVGIAIDRGDKFNGEISVGYGQNIVDGDGIEDFGGFITNFNLNWSPRRLTTITLNGTTAFDNFPSVATPGDITYDFDLTLVRNVRENLDFITGTGLIFQVNGASDDVDTTVEANIGLAYNISRNLIISLDYDFARQFTPGGVADFTSNTFSLGLRAER